MTPPALAEETVTGIDTYGLSDKQLALALRALPFPTILRTRGEAITAASLARNGWGDVEDGASGERIFRLNQAGTDAINWAREWDEYAARSRLGDSESAQSIRGSTIGPASDVCVPFHESGPST